MNRIMSLSVAFCSLACHSALAAGQTNTLCVSRRRDSFIYVAHDCLDYIYVYKPGGEKNKQFNHRAHRNKMSSVSVVTSINLPFDRKSKRAFVFPVCSDFAVQRYEAPKK